ncbi:MAG TPA: sugar transferase [Verrucomicrobiae bacterium]|nr:sugar transferase [Verrucomicrobiae bacterium]
MANRRREFIIQASQVADGLLIAAVFWLAHAFREQLAFSFPFPYRIFGYAVQHALIAPFRYYKWLYLIVLPLYPFLLDVNGFYSRSHSQRLRNTIWILLKSSIICTLAVMAAMFLWRPLSGLSRSVVVIFCVFSIVALFIKDQIFQAFLRHRARSGKEVTEIILVGAADRNAEFAALLEDHPEWSLRVAARLNLNENLLAELPVMLHHYPVGCVVFNVTQTAFSEIEKAILACEVEGVEAWLVADFFRTSIAKATVDDFYGKPLLIFRTTPEISWQLVCKRVIDVTGAFIGLVVLGPLLMLPVAIILKITSPGPVLFKQKRSGLHGRLFTMLKFRSMVTNAEMLKAELEVFNEMSGPVFKMQDDPRCTPFGRFLRRTSIDELPQLWNVLVGDMSLVGPRPPIPTEVQHYDPWHRRRLSVKPGLTCIWQISGRNRIGFDQWMKLDMEYIDNWSLWLDIKILFRTIPVVLSGLSVKRLPTPVPPTTPQPLPAPASVSTAVASPSDSPSLLSAKPNPSSPAATRNRES